MCIFFFLGAAWQTKQSLCTCKKQVEGTAYERSRRAVLARGTRESLFTLTQHKRNKQKVKKKSYGWHDTMLQMQKHLNFKYQGCLTGTCSDRIAEHGILIVVFSMYCMCQLLHRLNCVFLTIEGISKTLRHRETVLTTGPGIPRRPSAPVFPGGPWGPTGPVFPTAPSAPPSPCYTWHQNNNDSLFQNAKTAVFFFLIWS